MRNKQAKINYADLWGLREEKYKFLEENNISSTKWQSLGITDPYYFFVPKDFSVDNIYKKFISLKDVFYKHAGGIKTRRDNLMVANSRGELIHRFQLLLDSSLLDSLIAQSLKIKDTAYWQISKGRKIVSDSGDITDFIQSYDYRPFDKRYVYYNPRIIERGDARFPLMKHFLNMNLGLITMRQVFLNVPLSHFFITETLSDMRFMLSNRGAADVFPLYLYGNKAENTLFKDELSEKRSNLKVEFVALLNQTYNVQPFTTPLNHQKTFDIPPEQIFNYIYALLYSNIYRQKYQEFLKIDFPKIPFTKDYNLFQKLAELGEQLVNLHLLKSKELDNPISKFNGNNGNRVEKREYREKEKKVYINNHQYFSNIELNVWNYYIGGYQVLEKWLKDKKGRTLSAEDIKHYCKMATALTKTIAKQKQIDGLYPKVEKKLV